MAQQPVVTVPPAGPRRGATQFVEDFFIYNQNFLLIAPAAVQNQNIQVQADSAFKLTALSFQADIAAAAYTESTRPIPLCTLQMVDTGSGRQLFQNPAPIEAIFGNGQLPFILPLNRIFMPSSVIQMTLTNFSAATTYSVRLQLIGMKVFDLKSIGQYV